MTSRPESPPTHGPELFIGLAGAVGTDLDMVTATLIEVFETVGYTGVEIGLSSLLDLIDWSRIGDAPEIDDETLDRHIWTRMDAGDCLRERIERGDAVALLAILNITQKRREPTEPLQRHAFILRSLKHPEEVTTLRHVYGPNFFLISAYSPIATRTAYLERRIKGDWERLALQRGDRSAGGVARDLIERDVREAHRELGQRLGDTFPKADFFVDARHRESLRADLLRFIELVFDHPFHTPTKHENAMFHAQAAALRSAAPGRQVGCAIADRDGDVIAVGTNEVPKAGGGQYWSDDAYDQRDHKRDDPDVSGSEKRTVVEQVLRRVKQAGWLHDEWAEVDTDAFNRLLAGLRIQSLIEFERVVHAELSALIAAARHGKPVTRAYAYTTTFPCHECTRHLIASGVSRVYYIEPYPKSLAEKLHDDAIIIDPETVPDDRVAFLPFVGVAPRRYMEFFTPGPEGRKRAGRVASAKPGWFPKNVPGAQTLPSDSPAGPPKLTLPPSEPREGEKREHREQTTAAAAAADESSEVGAEATAPKEPEPTMEDDMEPEDDAPEADLSEESGVALGTEQLTVELSSDALYILREGNVLVEFDDAMERHGVDFQEAKE
jgi:cytidine deaminase